MGTTGVIFAAIAIAWLAYLVPHFVRHRDDEPTDEADPANRFSDSMRIVRHGTAPLLDQDLTKITTFEVSTPHTRRAAVHELRRLEALASWRRRRVLLVLLAAVSIVVGLCAVRLIPWWAVAVPGGLLVGFFVLSRVSVLFMRHSLDARYAAIQHGSNEKTVLLSRRDLAKVAEPATLPSGTAPALLAGSKAVALWDPVPITMPTYVSKPLAPRTVRTIDLSGPPVGTIGSEGPVTADARPAAVERHGAHRVESTKLDAAPAPEGGESRQAASA